MLHTYGRNLTLDLLLGGGVKPATVYLALMFTAPTVSDTGATINEPVGNGYARVAVTNDATNFPNATGGIKRNGTIITFPTATADWGTSPLAYAAICTALTGGEVIGSGPMSNARRIRSGQTPEFKVNQFALSVQ